MKGCEPVNTIMAVAFCVFLVAAVGTFFFLALSIAMAEYREWKNRRGG